MNAITDTSTVSAATLDEQFDVDVRVALERATRDLATHRAEFAAVFAGSTITAIRWDMGPLVGVESRRDALNAGVDHGRDAFTAVVGALLAEEGNSNDGWFNAVADARRNAGKALVRQFGYYLDPAVLLARMV